MSVVVTRACVSARAFENSTRVAFPNPWAISPDNAYPRYTSAIVAGAGIAFPSGTMADYVLPTAWTPAFTCVTPGDLSVAYSNRHGRRWKIGSMVVAEFGFTLSTFTHTTASGNVAITGLADVAANETDYRATGSVWWGGITKAGYTNVVPFMFNNDASIYLIGSGSGVGASQITMADMPSGGTPQIRGSIIYHV